MFFRKTKKLLSSCGSVCLLQTVCRTIMKLAIHLRAFLNVLSRDLSYPLRPVHVWFTVFRKNMLVLRPPRMEIYAGRRPTSSVSPRAVSKKDVFAENMRAGSVGSVYEVVGGLNLNALTSLTLPPGHLAIIQYHT
jgi:hypothetical protein